jgi:hypothetical protein
MNVHTRCRLVALHLLLSSINDLQAASTQQEHLSHSAASSRASMPCMCVVSNNELVYTVCLQLEYINGEIWANIWQTECIARICPDSGQVKGWVLMHGLQRNLADRGLSNHPMDVLNGKAAVGTKAVATLRVGSAVTNLTCKSQVPQTVLQQPSCALDRSMPCEDDFEPSAV